MSELEGILNYLETTSLESHDDYVSEFSYKDQKTLWKYIKELQQENQELKEQNQKYKEVINKIKEWEQNHTILVYTKNAPRKLVGTYELLHILYDKEVK